MKRRRGAGNTLPQEDGQGTGMKRGRRKRGKMYILIAVVIVSFVVLRLAGLAAAGDGGTVVTAVCAERGDIQVSLRSRGPDVGVED